MTGGLVKESKDRFETQRYKREGYGKTDTHRDGGHIEMEAEIGAVR